MQMRQNISMDSWIDYDDDDDEIENKHGYLMLT